MGNDQERTGNVIDLALWKARRRWREKDEALEAYLHEPWGPRPGAIGDGNRWVRLPNLEQTEGGWGPYQ